MPFHDLPYSCSKVSAVILSVEEFFSNLLVRVSWQPILLASPSSENVLFYLHSQSTFPVRNSEPRKFFPLRILNVVHFLPAFVVSTENSSHVNHCSLSRFSLVVFKNVSFSFVLSFQKFNYDVSYRFLCVYSIWFTELKFMCLYVSSDFQRFCITISSNFSSDFQFLPSKTPVTWTLIFWYCPTGLWGSLSIFPNLLLCYSY